MRLDAILETYGPALRRVAASYAPPGAEREDLEQEIVLALHTALGAWRGEASVRTYIYRIAHNCGMRHVKERIRAPGTEPVDDEHVIDRRTPERELGERQEYERLASAVRQLPLSMRQPMTLRLEGMSYEEIGTILGLSSSAVGVRLHRATAKLREIMKGGRP